MYRYVYVCRKFSYNRASQIIQNRTIVVLKLGGDLGYPQFYRTPLYIYVLGKGSYPICSHVWNVCQHLPHESPILDIQM